MVRANRDIARESPGTGSAGRQISIAPSAYAKPYVSVHESISKQEHSHRSTRLDLKLRHTRVSFVKTGHRTFDEERNSPEEAETTISEPPNSLSASIQDFFFDKPSLKDISSLRPSASSCGERSRNDIMRIPKYNGHISHHEIIKRQGIISKSTNSSGSFPPRADHLHEPAIRRRSSSHLSSSSEEIIIFSGRKQAKNKTLSATHMSISREGMGGDAPGSIGLTKLSSLIDLPSTKCERVAKPSRSTSPEGTSLGTTPFTRQLANGTKRGRALPDDPNPTSLRRSKKNRKYEQCPAHVIDTNQIHEDDSSRIDQVSGVSDDSSTDGIELRFSSREHMAHVKSPSRTQKNPDSDVRLGSRENLSPELKFVSPQLFSRKIYDEHTQTNQDLVPEGQTQLEVQEQVDCVNTEQKLRNLRIETAAQMPARGFQAKSTDQSLEFMPQAIDDEDGSQENDGLLLPSVAVFPPRILPKAGTIRKPKKSHSSATMNLDEPGFLDYGEFDIMDRQRPSIQNRGNMNSRHFNIEPCDMIFENHMQLVWEGDRAKKKLRKQARENLRQLGLLGKKGKVNLISQNARGFSIGHVEEQIKNFLQSSKESLGLPPMGQQDRKLVHEIANKLGLRSRSNGKGKNRFPVLYKTSKTGDFDAGALNGIVSRVASGRYLPRKDAGQGSGSNMSRRRFGGVFSQAAVSYVDGEIVGATAPELGQDNKGRAMLEKMGWSTGTALGALNNKGIMKPVAHVVKTSKAGLG